MKTHRKILGAVSAMIILLSCMTAVLPLDEDGNVYLVRQYRAPIDRVLLEIPAGKLDFPGEDPLECAKRELREETGLKAEEWRKLVALRTRWNPPPHCLNPTFILSTRFPASPMMTRNPAIL